MRVALGTLGAQSAVSPRAKGSLHMKASKLRINTFSVLKCDSGISNERRGDDPPGTVQEIWLMEFIVSL